MDLEVRHLRLVSTIADCGSLTRAGERLHLTQSALSHQLRDIEGRLGTKLFDRLNRRMVATPAGRALFKRALPLWAAAEQEVRDAMGAKLTADLHGAIDRSMEKLAAL